MILEPLKHKTVGIAGCGGLGSNCAVALARVGIGKLILADFDVVSESNLNRQYFFSDQVGIKKVIALRDNILRISKDIDVEIHDIRLRPTEILQLFSACDVIIEAFDTAKEKQMIIETVLSAMPDKYIISGVGLAGWGKNSIIKEDNEGKLIICGDTRNEVSPEAPPLAPRVGVVANMQANAALEVLLGECRFIK